MSSFDSSDDVPVKKAIVKKPIFTSSSEEEVLVKPVFKKLAKKESTSDETEEEVLVKKAGKQKKGATINDSPFAKIFKSGQYKTHKFYKAYEHIEKHGYSLSSADLDVFMTESIKGGKNAYFLNVRKDKGITLSKLFKNIKPTDQYINKIVNVYAKYGNGTNVTFRVIDALVSCGHVFSEDHKKTLTKAGYSNFLSGTFDESFVSFLATIDSEDVKSYVPTIKNQQNISADLVCLYIESIAKNKTYGYTNLRSRKRILSMFLRRCEIDPKVYTSLLTNGKHEIITEKLLNRIPPSPDQVQMIISTIHSSMVLFILRKHGLTITEELLYEFIGNSNKFAIDITNKEYFLDADYDFILKNSVQIDLDKDSSSSSEEVRVKARKSRNYNCYQETEEEKSYDEAELKNKFKYKNQLKADKIYCEVPVKLLFEYINLKPTIDTVYKYIEKGNEEIVDMLMDDFKIVPDKKCLDFAVYNGNLNIVNKVLCYKIEPDNETKKNISCDCDDKLIFQLYKNGLQFTIDDLEHFATNDVYISDLKSINIDYDERVYFIYYKYKYLDDIGMFNDMIILANFRALFKNKKTTREKIISEMEKNNLVIDQYCVDNMYIIGNQELIQYVESEYDCQPSMLAFIKTSSIYTGNCKPTYFLSKINITWEQMCIPIKKKD